MTLSETFSADLEWPNLEGVILDGGYELKQALGHTPAAATFQVRVLGGAGLRQPRNFIGRTQPRLASNWRFGNCCASCRIVT